MAISTFKIEFFHCGKTTMSKYNRGTINVTIKLNDFVETITIYENVFEQFSTMRDNERYSDGIVYDLTIPNLEVSHEDFINLCDSIGDFMHDGYELIPNELPESVNQHIYLFIDKYYYPFKNQHRSISLYDKNCKYVEEYVNEMKSKLTEDELHEKPFAYKGDGILSKFMLTKYRPMSEPYTPNCTIYDMVMFIELSLGEYHYDSYLNGDWENTYKYFIDILKLNEFIEVQTEKGNKKGKTIQKSSNNKYHYDEDDGGEEYGTVKKLTAYKKYIDDEEDDQNNYKYTNEEDCKKMHINIYCSKKSRRNSVALCFLIMKVSEYIKHIELPTHVANRLSVLFEQYNLC